MRATTAVAPPVAPSISPATRLSKLNQPQAAYPTKAPARVSLKKYSMAPKKAPVQAVPAVAADEEGGAKPKKKRALKPATLAKLKERGKAQAKLMKEHGMSFGGASSYLKKTGW